MPNYHITVGAIPHCQISAYHLFKERGLSSKLLCDCACACGYGENKEEAEADAAKLQAALTDLEVKVVEGNCGEDPWWATEDGLAAIACEEELQRDRYN